jgi:beta-glucanase (GH16 family)
MRSGIRSVAHLLLVCSTLLMFGCAKSDDGVPTRSFDDPLPPLASDDGSSDDPAAAAASGAAPGTPGAATPEYVLAFQDEFDGQAVDTTKWFVFDGDPNHRDTTNSASRALATVHDGSAFMSADRSPGNTKFPYAAGYVDTHGMFAQTYGKIEFRARCAYAPGVWYALWGRAWADLVPEIDIEFLGKDTSEVWFVNHWGVPPLPADQRRGATTVDGADITQFHTYTILWKPDLVEWQIDGKAYRRVTDSTVPHEAMFWVMNGWVGGWGGDPASTTQLPASIEIDYLRIYRLGTWVVPAAIRVANVQASYATGDTVDLELADFEAGAHVDVSEGSTKLGTLAKPPFRFMPSKLALGAHTLTFTGTDGSRTAATTLAVTIHQ